ncbi:penicillin-binding protein 2 [Tropicimonas sediminicola]|uniref:Peptidoglycan glycosyltransferase n=1 Tax=Tropicimonas sediminicola TaxID=1031541 RepID=A0A239KEH7_9RHOB|nr:penicillin-binding protein 2 [Tropicimonas sediminicola]SNT16571.1 peptidoglycan glycosyltransferase [Tropicimonas sediminicola]
MRRPPKDTEESARRITRRGLVLGGSMLGFMGVLGARMRYMQIDQAEQFRLLAEENRINIRLIPPARGLIFDRTGVPIAENTQNYRIVIVREDAGDLDETFAKLRELVPLTDDDVERAMREIRRRSPFVPVTIADQLAWEDVAEVAVNAPALPGVTPEVGLTRHYPLEDDFAHVVGYVGPVSDYDLSKLEDPDPLLQIPKFQIGKVGLEARQEDLLRGSAGTKRIEVNAGGRVMRELSRQEGKKGADLQLTVDHGLQNFINARLVGESAAAVVMDVRSGDVLAIASSPSFDPNLFVRGISVKDYKALTENDHRPLANKSVQGTYPPGSTFKMVTALAAHEAGVVTAGETIYCPGYKQLGTRRFHCWKRGGHGYVDLHDSLMRSCDVYYYELAERVGIDRISEMAVRLGIGVRHDLPMSAIAEGLAPTKAWKQGNRQESWMVGDSLNASIGQGFVLASPLQLCVMTARIATGEAIRPRLVKSVDTEEQPILSDGPLGLSPTTLSQVRKAMFSVSNSRQGTAYRSRLLPEDMKLAGKTGTSQVRSVVVDNKNVPWEQRDHALFVCFAPYDNPRIAVSVVVEHGGGGSTAAAPVARDIVARALWGDLPPLDIFPSGERDSIAEIWDSMPLRRKDGKTGRSDRA